MIRFDHEKIDFLVAYLRDQPGFITAAVVPAGFGGALMERLHDEIKDLEIVEVVASRERPVDLGNWATEFGQSQDGRIFVLRLDEPGLFGSEDEAVEFWRLLNYQRENLASGNVRTCFLLNEETELFFAQRADDLWGWTTTFRFPEAARAVVRTIEDSEALVWKAHPEPSPPSDAEIALLRGQWLRSRQYDLPSEALVESYSIPLFLALPISFEALQLWERDLRETEVIARLAPETILSVARRMMDLIGLKEAEIYSEELTQSALEITNNAVATLEPRAAEHPDVFEVDLAAGLSASAKIHQDAGKFEAALWQIAKCLDRLKRLSDFDHSF